MNLAKKRVCWQAAMGKIDRDVFSLSLTVRGGLFG